MHSTNLFKYILYTFIVSIWITCLYFCTSLIVNGTIENYNKAAWYYHYNQVDIEPTANIEDLKQQYTSMIGYQDERLFHLEDQEITVYQLISAIALENGAMPKTENEVVISREIADYLIRLYQLEKDQDLFGRDFLDYRICGITGVQMQKEWVIYIKEIPASSTHRLLFSPSTDMETLQEQSGFTLNQHDQVIGYMQKIMKALDLLAIVSLFCLGVDLLLSKLSHFNMLHTFILNGLGIILSIGIICISDGALNQWLSTIPYLQLQRQWAYLIVPSVFILILNLGIKKIKFFN